MCKEKQRKILSAFFKSFWQLQSSEFWTLTILIRSFIFVRDKIYSRMQKILFQESIMIWKRKQSISLLFPLKNDTSLRERSLKNDLVSKLRLSFSWFLLKPKKSTLPSKSFIVFSNAIDSEVLRITRCNKLSMIQ